jgi:hypothetical protein
MQPAGILCGLTRKPCTMRRLPSSASDSISTSPSGAMPRACISASFMKTTIRPPNTPRSPLQQPSRGCCALKTSLCSCVELGSRRTLLLKSANYTGLRCYRIDGFARLRLNFLPVLVDLRYLLRYLMALLLSRRQRTIVTRQRSTRDFSYRFFYKFSAQSAPIIPTTIPSSVKFSIFSPIEGRPLLSESSGI